MKTYILKMINLFVALWIYFPTLNAQQGDTLFIQRGREGKIGFAIFAVNENSDRKMKNDTVFLKSILKAKKEDRFRLKSEATDEMGITHKKYLQYYKGIKVDNAEYLVHGRNNNIEVINGDFQDISIETIEPTITEQQALKKALEYVGAKKYKWEDPNMERFIKQLQNNPNATYYPSGELVISKDYLKGSNSFKLSWQFTISSMEPDNEQMIFVNAVNGEVIRDVPLILSANTSGSVQTRYSGTQTITNDSYSNGFRLFESRNTTLGNNLIIRNNVTIHTLNCLNGTNYANATEFSNTNTNWTSGNWATFAQNQVALDAHWGAEKVIDYWTNVHSRNSLNNSGLNITNYVHYNVGWGNAQWDSNNKVMCYGDGTTSNPFTSLDIIAHEMGHGITQFTANLAYDNNPAESAALNEGFSDIWAACVKAWAAPNKPIWLMGGEIVINPFFNCIRNMQNPKSNLASEGPHPNTYHGEFWSNANEPHFNSTVLSYWFYLVCEGGAGTNDNGDAYNIVGIGINKGERIAYQTVLYYLNSSANYTAARNATIQAATAIFGTNSQEVVSVTNAWHAVGIGNMYPPIISGPSQLCSTAIYSISNPPSGTASIIWTVSSHLSIVSGQGTTSLTVNYDPRYATRENITASFLANGQSVAATKQVEIGSVGFNFVLTDPITGNPPTNPVNERDYIFSMKPQLITLTPSQNEADYYWTLTYAGKSSSSYVYTTSGYGKDFYVNVPDPGPYKITLNYNGDDCIERYTEAIFSFNERGIFLGISPNPVSAEVTVEVIDNTDSPYDAVRSTEPTYTVQIVNLYGIKAYSGTKRGNKFNLSVSSLSNGIYDVIVSDGIQTCQEKLIVKH